MTNSSRPCMLTLGDARLRISPQEDDIRGRTVIDNTGRHIGTVKELLLDEEKRRVRLIDVHSGGFLGLGQHTLLVPAEAIAGIEADNIQVDLTPDEVIGRPTYDPDLIPDQKDWQSYARSGYKPFRSPDELDPVYPRYPHDWR